MTLLILMGYICTGLVCFMAGFIAGFVGGRFGRT